MTFKSITPSFVALLVFVNLLFLLCLFLRLIVPGATRPLCPPTIPVLAAVLLCPYLFGFCSFSFVCLFCFLWLRETTYNST